MLICFQRTLAQSKAKITTVNRVLAFYRFANVFHSIQPIHNTEYYSSLSLSLSLPFLFSLSVSFSCLSVPAIYFGQKKAAVYLTVAQMDGLIPLHIHRKWIQRRISWLMHRVFPCLFTVFCLVRSILLAFNLLSAFGLLVKLVQTKCFSRNMHFRINLESNRESQRFVSDLSDIPIIREHETKNKWGSLAGRAFQEGSGEKWRAKRSSLEKFWSK